MRRPSHLQTKFKYKDKVSKVLKSAAFSHPNFLAVMNIINSHSIVHQGTLISALVAAKAEEHNNASSNETAT